MRQLPLNKDFTNSKFLNSLIEDFLHDLQVDRFKNRQKILELCHVAKFLSFFEGKYKIEKIREKPDFIISDQTDRIGLEHQVLIDNKTKEKEGLFENIFRHAEQILIKEIGNKNFLANIYVNSSYSIKINDKNQIIRKVVEIIKGYLDSEKLSDNKIIEDILIMPHSRISLCPNFGAWYQKDITPDLLINAIKKKEHLLANYTKITNLKQWLLIVIGGTGESSYEFENNFGIETTSNFDKIFLLEDFNYNLYEIK